MKQRGKIAGQTHHQHLTFGIAETAIIFDQLRPFTGQHQPGEQHPDIGRAFGSERGDGGTDDAVHHLGLERFGQYRGRAVGAHAAGVGSGVAVADALVILRAAEGDDIGAVGQGEEARLLAGHEFLDHHLCPGAAKGAREHVGDRGFGLGARLGDNHALARGEPVGLDHDRNREIGERGQCGFGAGAAHIAGGRNRGARAQILGKAL